MIGTAEVTIYSLRRKGHIVRLFDTPGFDDSKKGDIEILSEVAFWLTSAYAAEPKLLLSGIVYLHPINKPKMQSSAMKNLTMFKLLCGRENLSSVVLATTMWDSRGSQADKQMRQQALIETAGFWGSMIDQGSTVLRHDNTQASAFKIIDHIIEQKRSVVLDIQRQMVDKRMIIEDTSAGQETMRAVLEEKKKMQERLERSKEELHEALQTKVQENVEVLQREKEGFESKIKEKDESIHVLRLDAEALVKMKELQWKRELQEMEKAREKDEARLVEIQRQIAKLKAGPDPAVAKMSLESRIRTLEEDLATLIEANDLRQRRTMKRITLWGTIFGGVGAIIAGAGACSLM